MQKATLQDKDKILNFLAKSPLYNLFLIGDVEEFGVENDFIKSYIKYNNQNEILFFILIFQTTLLFYDPLNQIQTNELSELISKHNITNIFISDEMFQNKKEFFEQLKDFKINYQIIAKANKKFNGPINLAQKATNLEQIKKIVESRFQIDEFKDFRNENFATELNYYEQAFLKNISNNYFIEINNQVVAHASVAAKTDQAEMIGGVYCLKEFRNNGYATQVTVALLNEIIDRNKTPILFFHNPKAGLIYNKIGFENFGKVYTLSKVADKE
ncbi:GNAT family N-acetyltransferase [Mycoplasmopsis gallinarum]|uniref:N-acetyltransferase domain-containing protein n=1 Tax=Mycoplasmopsis gallinarum TaxID=29557 RepID=A0A168RER2_9BACT|nr:GNAT family N-acetyltransferase [Mycoplasmopsis gallinarum]OAB48906.1 hypothetical protein MGALLINA_03460 [Mycoplasmopsis gallinarum]